MCEPKTVAEFNPKRCRVRFENDTFTLSFFVDGQTRSLSGMAEARTCEGQNRQDVI